MRRSGGFVKSNREPLFAFQRANGPYHREESDSLYCGESRSEKVRQEVARKRRHELSPGSAMPLVSVHYAIDTSRVPRRHNYGPLAESEILALSQEHFWPVLRQRVLVSSDSHSSVQQPGHATQVPGTTSERLPVDYTVPLPGHRE